MSKIDGSCEWQTPWENCGSPWCPRASPGRRPAVLTTAARRLGVVAKYPSLLPKADEPYAPFIATEMADGAAASMRQALDALSRLCAEAENGSAMSPELPQEVQACMKSATLDYEAVVVPPQGLPSALPQLLVTCRQVLTAFADHKIVEVCKRHCEKAARLLGGLSALTGAARETTVAYAATAGLLVSGILQSASISLEFYRGVLSATPASHAVAQHVFRLLDDLCDPALLRSLLNFFPSIRDCIKQITSDSSCAAEWTDACYSAYGSLLSSCSSLSKAILDGAASDITLQPAASRGSSSSPGQRRGPALPSRAATVLDNLRGVDWLAGVSRALLDTPALPASLGPEALASFRRTGYRLGESLVSLHQVMSSIVMGLGGGSSEAVGPLLSRVSVLAVQPDVVRAQRGLLRRLLVHGGVQPPPVPAPASAPARRRTAAAGQQRQQEQSGAWALTEAEQQLGRAVHDPSVTPAGECDRQLEAEHVCVLHATLGLWRGLHEHKGLHQQSSAAVLPSYEEMAVLGAAAAKAFRRLQLGQGLGGAFRASAVPPASAVLARNIMMMTNCAWDGGQDSDAMEAAEAGACLPYWLEAKGHLLAMAAECVEGGREAERTAQARYDGRVSVLQLANTYGTAADSTMALLGQAQELLMKGARGGTPP